MMWYILSVFAGILFVFFVMWWVKPFDMNIKGFGRFSMKSPVNRLSKRLDSAVSMAPSAKVQQKRLRLRITKLDNQIDDLGMDQHYTNQSIDSLEGFKEREKARLEGNLAQETEFHDKAIENRKEIRGSTTLQNKELDNLEKTIKQKSKKSKQRVVLKRQLKTLENE